MQADVIGEVTESGRLTIEFQGETVLDVPPRSVAHDGPVYRRPIARPQWQDALQANTSASLARPEAGELRELILRMIASPNLCSRGWVTDQYDRYVRGNTVLAQPADAGIVRVAEPRTGPTGSCDGHRLQRPLHPARPVRGRAARAGRGLPQRRHHRCGAAGRHRTA